MKPYSFVDYVEKNLVWSKYADFCILIDPSNANPGYWQTCVENILSKGVSSPDGEEHATSLVFANMKNDIFPQISNMILLNVLTLCRPVKLETSSVIDWNMYVALQCNIKSKLTNFNYAKSFVAVKVDAPKTFVSYS